MKGSRYSTPEGIKPGDVFGSLTIISFVGRNSRYQARFSVKCTCGGTSETLGSNLKRGTTTNCNASLHRQTHGATGSAEHNAWKAMKSRVRSKRPEHARVYRDKGIIVCAEWENSFTSFLAHVGMMPKPGLEIDRYPNRNGNYEPGNVRWANHQEQMRNTAQNLMLTANGQTRCLTEWSEISGIHTMTLKHRFKRGWPESQLFSAPNPKRRKRCA